MPKDPRLYSPTPTQNQPSPPPQSGNQPSIQRGPADQTYITKPAASSITSPHSGVIEIQGYDPRYPTFLLRPDSRPISQEQLASEVKSIYAGLTMVETKCIHVDRAQAAALQDSSNPSPKLASDHWQALLALHRTLLHEHHDFFLASQHPSASKALRRLARKYSIPARMWRHGIHSFLEILRRRLPESIDYMLAFIYLAYQIMALLYETVPVFEDTWTECLGDLGRYRMAIEDENVRDRETWAGIARSWYSKAVDKNPSVGRLYHHLAILARPNALQQLYYYARSLTCVRPFLSARESILTLLEPVLDRSSASCPYILSIDASFIQAHGILFHKISTEKFKDAQLAFQNQLDNHIGRVAAKWKEQGVYIAVTNVAGLFDYGSDDSVLRQALVFHGKRLTSPSSVASQSDEDSRSPSPVEHDTSVSSMTESDISLRVSTLASDVTFTRARFLTMSTFALVLRRIGDKNVLPHVHIIISFLATFASIDYVSQLIGHVPWAELVLFLNALLKSEQGPEIAILEPVFPEDQADNLPLPEDYLIHGQIWSQWYFPEDWFKKDHDEEDRYMELPSTIKLRTERVLHLGYKLANVSKL